MPLSAGARLGPHEVIAPLGAGGMGEVYKARDTRLDRLVAIKVLPAAWSQDPDRRARFDREARAVAAVSHPNICALHDIGHQDGIDFLVLEYLEGETLAARLDGSKPLSIDETLRIATQVADALTAAHRAGVIHRDLKPSNVMLTRTGVKVLDFGLAKLAVADDASSSATSLETAPPLTGLDRIMGTLPYMSPEQIEGRSVDARSDLFAFGAIVYEMTTGRRAFHGSSQASLIAAILDRTPPPITEAQPLTPPALERLVHKCLAKDPAARWQSASDVADELRWLASGSVKTSAAPHVVSPRKRLRLAWLAIAVTLVASAVWVWVATRERSSSSVARETLHQQVTFSGKVITANLSRDGRSVAYGTGAADDYRVLVRDLDSGRELEIWKGTRFFDLEWLPDGSRIAIAGRTLQQRESPLLYKSGMLPQQQGIWIASRLGGPAQRLDAGGTYIAISPDGTNIASATQTAAGVTITPLAGGAPRRIAGAGFRFLYGIDWTRSDRLLIPVAMDNGEAAIVGATPESDVLQPVFNSAVSIRAICASPTADAFYLFTGTKLERVAFVKDMAQTPEVLLTGVAPTGLAPIKTCSVASDGERLLHIRYVSYANLWRLDLDRAGRVATQLTKGTSHYAAPQTSRDGHWIVFSGGPQDEVAKMSVSGGQPIPLVRGTAAVWSPNGQRLAFLTDQKGRLNLWVGDQEGRQAIEQHRSEIVRNYLLTWLPDGRLAWRTADGRNYQIRDLDSGREEFLVEDPSVGWVFVPRFNARGDTVAVYWNRKPDGLWTLSWPGRVARFLAPDLVPDGWSPDGAWIYAHREGTRSIVRVSPKTGAAEPVGDFPVGSLTGHQVCDVARDGGAIVCSLQEANTDAWVIHHFDDRVR